MENKDFDMDDWEVIPYHGFQDHGLHSPKKDLQFNPQMDNYFVCPSTSPVAEDTINVKELHNEIPDKEVEESQGFKDIGVVPPAMYIDHEVVEMLKMESKEQEMKMESPRIENKEEEMKMEVPKAAVRFEDEDEEKKDGFEETGKEEVYKEERIVEKKRKASACCGFGALCSIGVAAATICIFVLGGKQQQQQKHNFQSQRIQFQMYSDDKRMKQVVQQANRLNQAISVAVRGVPMTRAHISFGGYYDGI